MTCARPELQDQAQDSRFPVPDASEIRAYLPESVVLRHFGKSIRHVGPDGRMLFGGGACHGMAIAALLKVSLPVSIGLVHDSGRFRLPQVMA